MDWQVAVVRWETREEGPNRGLVLAPLYDALLCATFLTSGIPELPHPNETTLIISVG